jgi:hypothetical protein
MDFQQFTPDNEANDRNAVLSGQYSKIPSYALWMEYDIEKETQEERINWWKNYENVDNIVWKTLANQWLEYFKEKIVEPSSSDDESIGKPNENSPKEKESNVKSNENTQEVKDNNQEFCSKRFTNELYCDI